MAGSRLETAGAHGLSSLGFPRLWLCSEQVTAEEKSAADVSGMQTQRAEQHWAGVELFCAPLSRSSGCEEASLRLPPTMWAGTASVGLQPS